MSQSRTENFVLGTVTIPADGSMSDAFYIEGLFLLGFVMPSGWNAADMSVQASMDVGIPSNWLNVFDTVGNEWVATTAASRFCLLRTDRPWLGGMRWLKLRSGVTGSPVNQDADRIITVICGYPNA